jgi:hypothetical protein
MERQDKKKSAELLNEYILGHTQYVPLWLERCAIKHTLYGSECSKEHEVGQLPGLLLLAFST